MGMILLNHVLQEQSIGVEVPVGAPLGAPLDDQKFVVLAPQPRSG
jgi:hypothetical protein